jgi:peptidoglycan/xylan/chitin deacetylase (PgdA/CDA1 family)
MSRRERAARLLTSSGVRPLARLTSSRPGLVVLNYHRIAERSSPPLDRGLWSATPEGFAAQLDLLRRHFDVISSADLAEALASKRGRRVLITFDDGYRDNYQHAFPALRAAGLPATFFLSTGYLDRPRLSWWDEIAWMIRGSSAPEPETEIREATDRYKQLSPEDCADFLDQLGKRTGRGRAPAEAANGTWMTWDMAREMHDGGMAIAGHTVDHPVLSRLPRDAQRQEIEGCAERLREELGVEMGMFSYPVGLPDCFDRNTRELLEEGGVRFAFSNYGGYEPPGQADQLDIKRTNVGWDMSMPLFESVTRWPKAFARW